MGEQDKPRGAPRSVKEGVEEPIVLSNTEIRIARKHERPSEPPRPQPPNDEKKDDR